MSQAANSVASSTNSKRSYRKGKPLTVAERQQALAERRKETHKEIKVYVPSEFKLSLQNMCQAEGVTQAEMICRLIADACGQHKE
jgi:hypothetical protein